MKLNIISLKGIQFDGDVTSLNIKTTDGEITVLDNHRPLMTSLALGKAHVVKKGGEKSTFDIVSGFLEVGTGNKATLLVD